MKKSYLLFCMCFDMHRVLRKSSGDNFRTERKNYRRSK